MGYRCLACSKVSARTWATVVRRCGWPGGYDAAAGAHTSAANTARIGIPLEGADILKHPPPPTQVVLALPFPPRWGGCEPGSTGACPIARAPLPVPEGESACQGSRR